MSRLKRWALVVVAVAAIAAGIGPMVFAGIGYPQTWLGMLDRWIFFLLNGMLPRSELLQWVMAGLNHRYENKVGVVVFLLFNLQAIIQAPVGDRRRRLMVFGWCWLTLEIGILLQHQVFHKWLHIQRESPSLVLEPSFRLSVVFDNLMIKDQARDSFPSGHAFVVTYWGLFHRDICQRWNFASLLVFALFLPRLFSGAHWLSDILSGFALAYFYHGLMRGVLKWWPSWRSSSRGGRSLRRVMERIRRKSR